MDYIELNAAFHWECPKCKTDNFCKGVLAEIDDEEKAYLLKEYGEIEGGWVTGEFIVHPNRVSCSNCKTIFRPRDPEEEIPEDDEDFDEDQWK